MINIANYLITHYKGTYRILVDCDLLTKQFPRKLDGTYEDIDCYISCANKVRVFSFGRGILQAYIPSLGRGRNYIKAIQSELGDDIIFDIEQTDSEVLFKFNAKYMDKLEKHLKPRTSGAKISPFSNKNLPKNKDYKIPDEDLVKYKDLIAKLPQNQLLFVGKYTQNYLKSLVTKKNTWEDIKADMALKGLKGKEYIHNMGKWNEYIEYLNKEIKS